MNKSIKPFESYYYHLYFLSLLVVSMLVSINSAFAVENQQQASSTAAMDNRVNDGFNLVNMIIGGMDNYRVSYMTYIGITVEKLGERGLIGSRNPITPWGSKPSITDVTKDTYTLVLTTLPENECQLLAKKFSESNLGKLTVDNQCSASSELVFNYNYLSKETPIVKKAQQQQNEGAPAKSDSKRTWESVHKDFKKSASTSTWPFDQKKIEKSVSKTASPFNAFKTTKPHEKVFYIESANQLTNHCKCHSIWANYVKLRKEDRCMITTGSLSTKFNNEKYALELSYDNPKRSIGLSAILKPESKSTSGKLAGVCKGYKLEGHKVDKDEFYGMPIPVDLYINEKEVEACSEMLSHFGHSCTKP